MHSKAKGDIFVYMDDDDYYPPDRVKEAVTKLAANPSVLVAGCSRMYLYYTHLDKIYALGPYSKNHATAGTFAFKKELLKYTKYDDNADMAEEKFFLKGCITESVPYSPI